MTRLGVTRVLRAALVAGLLAAMVGGGPAQADEIPLVPDVVATAPTSVRLGDPLTVDVGAVDPGGDPGGSVSVSEGSTSLASAPLVSGEAELDVDTEALGVGAHTLTVRHLDAAGTTTSEQPLAVLVRRALVTLSVPSTAVAWGDGATIPVSSDRKTAGLVVGSIDGDIVAWGSIADRRGDLAVDWTMVEPGTHTLTVRTTGDASTEPARTSATLTVSKAPTTLTATPPRGKVVVRRTRAVVGVTVTSGRLDVAGTVVIRSGSREIARGALADGVASVRLPVLGRTGTRTFTVDYLGDAHAAASTGSVTLKVVRR